MRALLTKAILLLALFAAFNMATRAIAGHLLADRFDPRTRLLREAPAAATRVAIIGDSVFNSSYVDREEDALWSVLSRHTGLAVFPGALDGARGGDLLAAARRLSELLPAGAHVFVDVHPATSWTRADVAYREDLTRAWGYVTGAPTASQRIWNRFGRPFFGTPVLWRDLLPALLGRDRRSYFGGAPTFDRVWSRDTDFPLGRYRAFERALLEGGAPRAPDPAVVRELHSVLAARGIELVFVLTPLNTALIHAWSTPEAGAAVRQGLDARHRENLQLLRSHGYAFIDLWDAVPPEGFADLLHTNALGDAILARAMAAHLAPARR